MFNFTSVVLVRASRLAGAAIATLALATAALPAQAPATASGTPLRLADALARAEQGAYANRAAAGARDAADADAFGALRGVLPAARLEGGVLRTDDPVGAFGIRLRQRSITQADFDPVALNNPDPLTNVGSAAVLEQPLPMPGAIYGRRAASRAADAADASLAWTTSGTRVDVVRAYFGAQLAAAKVDMLGSALRSAQSHVSQAEALVRQGVVTRSDALLASVRRGEVESALLGARSDARLAGRRLALVLGAPEMESLALASPLPEDASLVAVAEEARRSTVSSSRGDVESATLAAGAATEDARRARAALLPQLAVFARVDWADPSNLVGGKPYWSAGLMGSWPLFTGGTEIAGVRAAAGRERSARAMAEAARARAALELEESTAALDVALARLAIAADAEQQGEEAHRIVARKYEGGIAAITELLDADAARTQARLGHAAARYDVVVAIATLRHARGLDLAPILAFDR